MRKHHFAFALFLGFLFSFPGYSQQEITDLQVFATDSAQNIRFDDYFLPMTLRVDYFMAGDNKGEIIYLDRLKQEPYWSGSRNHLIDPFNAGSFRVIAFDSATRKMIYTKGFCNLFQEWQGTPEAKTVKRAFAQTAVMPFPKSTILFEIDRRSYSDGKFVKLFELYINPADYSIIKDKVHPIPFEKFINSGRPENKVDVAFIAEGYKADEMYKFMIDAGRIAEYFLSVRPYSDYINYFNFYAIKSPSDESGIDIPGQNIYVNTNMNSSFYTFDMDRYLTSDDSRSIYDIAANVPYDVVFILVNSKRYGGGGFFNHYGESTVDNYFSNIVAVHEFGHSFAGLADEYYDAEITYSDFYNLAVEPWEPNITTNVDFDSKWKRYIHSGTPLPTPRSEEYKDKVGMFEGGGYVGKGIYSPVMDCRMKSNEAPGFCPVCDEAIRKMIRYYSE